MRKYLSTKRLILRPWRYGEELYLYDMAKSEKIGPNVGWTPHRSLKESSDILNFVLMKENTFAITIKDEDIPIGNISLNDSSTIEFSSMEMEMGFYLSEKKWHRGYMTEAVNEMIRYGFEDIGLKRIWCCHFTENEASKRVQKRCGFKYHHTNRGIYVPALDEKKDQIVNFLDAEDIIN